MNYHQQRQAARRLRSTAYTLTVLGWLMCAAAFISIPLRDPAISTGFPAVTVATMGFILGTVGFRTFAEYQRRIARLPSEERT